MSFSLFPKKSPLDDLTASLIVATYNWKEALALVLDTALAQTRLPDEIVIADDGSREDTVELVRGYASNSPVPILHAWQPDTGFRLARSRNNAIAASSGDYLIFLDGDCFLNKHFIEDHLSFAEPDRYVVGTRVNITPKRKEYIFQTGDVRITPFSWGTTKRLHAIRSRFLAAFRRHGGMAGANFAAWRSDVERINGFNEIFEGHGGEDGEFADRLEQAGVRRKKMVHLGIAYHFAHPINPPGERESMRGIYDTTLEDDGIRCKVGLNRAVGEKAAPETENSTTNRTTD